MQLFYCPDIQGATYTLNEEESKHCVRVLRMGNGDQFHITDGKGGLFTVEIIDEHPKRCSVQVINSEIEYQKRSTYLHLAVAPTKNISRYEWFLEKATEIGIDEITPIICEHSERKEVKIKRLIKVVVAAIKQSLKAYIPKLNETIKFKDLISTDFDGDKYIAYCEGEPQLLKNAYKSGKNALILIGPEGDFSPEEVDLAIKNGFQTISLGQSRLRTETAAIAACHTINLLND
ncbi:MAG: 16S rRNA (uracil(1498)-N(3))-methyltransferase [Bacteroidetes bacterium]|nr:16S rRNA (uracil(1498)-N(3))-methyltransferase [Bacteroidota bacterium]